MESHCKTIKNDFFFRILFFVFLSKIESPQQNKTAKQTITESLVPSNTARVLFIHNSLESVHWISCLFHWKKVSTKKNWLIKAFISDVRFNIESNSIESHSISELLAASTLAIIKLSNYSQLFFFRFFIIETGDCDAFVPMWMYEWESLSPKRYQSSAIRPILCIFQIARPMLARARRRSTLLEIEMKLFISIGYSIQLGRLADTHVSTIILMAILVSCLLSLRLWVACNHSTNLNDLANCCCRFYWSQTNKRAFIRLVIGKGLLFCFVSVRRRQTNKRSPIGHSCHRGSVVLAILQQRWIGRSFGNKLDETGLHQMRCGVVTFQQFSRSGNPSTVANRLHLHSARNPIIKKIMCLMSLRWFEIARLSPGNHIDCACKCRSLSCCHQNNGI